MTNRSGDPYFFSFFLFSCFLSFFFCLSFFLLSLPVLVGLGQPGEVVRRQTMTFDKTWQLALLGSNRFSGNFAGLVNDSESRITKEGISIRVPCGGEPSGQRMLLGKRTNKRSCPFLLCRKANTGCRSRLTKTLGGITDP